MKQEIMTVIRMLAELSALENARDELRTVLNGGK